MGGLIVLLVAMSHVSRQQARAKAAEPTARVTMDPAERKASQRRAEQLSRAEAYLKKLAVQQTKADNALRDEQLRLSQIESHIQRLTDKLASQRAAVAELIRTDSQHYDDRQQAERNLKRLTKMIDETKSEIESLKEEQSGQSKSYAIVPYKGANGTRRKPIYIECTAGKVILQPEGVELSASDFLRPLGVGNPLAAALRSTREYLKRQDSDTTFDPDAEPYPLILVRPDGVEEYYGVRAAIRTWDSDFGYELVDSDWDLTFPTPNPELARQQVAAIERSRLRRASLARAAPRAYRGQGRGIAVVQSAEGGGHRRGFDGQPYDGDILGESGGARSGDPLGSQAGDPGLAMLDEGSVSKGNGSQNFGGEASRLQENSPTLAASEGKIRSGNQRATATSGTGAQGGLASSPSSGAALPGGSSKASGQQAATSGGGSSERSSPGGSASQQVAQVRVAPPVAASRGDNWAVDRKSPSDIAIRRSVQVVVRGDHLMVLPGREQPVPSAFQQDRIIGETVQLDGPTRSGLDEFVGHVKQQVSSWGMAGQGLYWRPVVKLNVAPDGQRRALDLARLLDRSGIDVEFERTASLPSAQPVRAGKPVAAGRNR